MRSLSNLECVGETLRAALDDLASLVPDWLVQQVSPDWFDRYSHRVENYRLPKSESQRTALATQIGADGLHLLEALDRPDTPEEGKGLESVEVLRRVWQQYYEVVKGQAKWRAGPQANADEGVIRSPYDPEAQTGKKRETVWLGYKVHLTEICAESSETTTPNLIVQVQTTVAPLPDGEMTAPIQAALERASLKPDEHLVDTGYVDADQLARSGEQGIRLIGPTMPDTRGPGQRRQGL